MIVMRVTGVLMVVRVVTRRGVRIDTGAGNQPGQRPERRQDERRQEVAPDPRPPARPSRGTMRTCSRGEDRRQR